MIHVVQTIDDLHAVRGGPSRTVQYLSQALCGNPELTVSIVCSKTLPSMVDAPRDITTGRHIASGIIRAIRLHPTHASIVHDNGLWCLSNFLSASTAKLLRKPIVISPHGMLEPWALKHHRLRKRIAMAMYQRRCLFNATGFHATSPSEVESLRRIGLRQPIALVANGIESIPENAATPEKERIALFLSRLHPKKGILELVTAWSRVRPPGWQLHIVGPDDGGYKGTIEKAVATLGLTKCVHFFEAATDLNKWQHYRRALLFVLPTYSENFGLVIGEALAAGTAVITTTETPWERIAEKGCGWIIKPEIEELSNVLRTATSLPDDVLIRMGRLGQNWVPSEYSWNAIGKQMGDFYTWLLNGQQRETTPKFVIRE